MKTNYEIQGRLDVLGYYKGEFSGLYNPQMGAAIREFQAASGLEANGLFDTETEVAMFAPNAKRKAGAGAVPKGEPASEQGQAAVETAGKPEGKQK